MPHIKRILLSIAFSSASLLYSSEQPEDYPETDGFTDLSQLSQQRPNKQITQALSPQDDFEKISPIPAAIILSIATSPHLSPTPTSSCTSPSQGAAPSPASKTVTSPLSAISKLYSPKQSSQSDPLPLVRALTPYPALPSLHQAVEASTAPHTALPVQAIAPQAIQRYVLPSGHMLDPEIAQNYMENAVAAKRHTSQKNEIGKMEYVPAISENNNSEQEKLNCFEKCFYCFFKHKNPKKQ